MSTIAFPAPFGDGDTNSDPFAGGDFVAAHVVESKRATWPSVLLILPIILAGISWQLRGVTSMTDMAFVILTGVCAVCCFTEVRDFPQRFGVGGLVLYGGTLVWYCHDYFTTWFNNTSFDALFRPETVAKGAFFTMLYIWIASIGLRLPSGRRLVRITRRIPVLQSSGAYVLVIATMFVIGIVPYLFFSAEPFYLAFWHSITGLRTGAGAVFTAGRTGSYNYSWGGYLAQVIQVGEVGGILAAMYVIMVPGSKMLKLIACLIWLFWAAWGFGSGSRGELLFMVLPAVGLIVMKAMLRARDKGKRFSFKGIFYPVAIMLFILVFIQIQGQYRNVGLSEVELGSVGLFEARGNTQFTEGLLAYQTFPDTFPFAANTFPGAALIRPIPDTALRFAIGWIPRVLWHDKPGISETLQWYNASISGGTAVNEEGGPAAQGGTVCPSIPALAYLSYGPLGVIQMALLFGWLCRLAEDMLRANLRRPFAMMFALGCCSYLFRAFRDLTPHDFYPLAIGVVAGSFLMWILNMLAGTPREQFPEDYATSEYAGGEMTYMPESV